MILLVLAVVVPAVLEDSTASAPANSGTVSSAPAGSSSVIAERRLARSRGPPVLDPPA